PRLRGRRALPRHARSPAPSRVRGAVARGERPWTRSVRPPATGGEDLPWLLRVATPRDGRLRRRLPRRGARFTLHPPDHDRRAPPLGGSRHQEPPGVSPAPPERAPPRRTRRLGHGDEPGTLSRRGLSALAAGAADRARATPLLRRAQPRRGRDAGMQPGQPLLRHRARESISDAAAPPRLPRLPSDARTPADPGARGVRAGGTHAGRRLLPPSRRRLLPPL